MSYAVIVVVEADDVEAAWDDVAQTVGDEAGFVGRPWPVEDRSEQCDYDQVELIKQHPRVR